MKKSIKKMAVVALMLVAGSTMTVNAQLLSEKPRVHFGIRGGVSASSYSGDGIKSKIFPMGGFAVDFKVAPIPLYLESGLYYVNRGYKLDIPDEYYYDEIIDSEVVDLSGNHIGIVKEIMTTGANDVWIVKREGQSDALIPLIDDVVKEINVDDKLITIDVLEGLLD